jgi:hypothetical protein
MHPALEKEYTYRINEAVWTRTTYIQPHEYIVYERYPELCALISGLINEEGYTKEFQGSDYQHIDLDGYKYWFICPILNRELLRLTDPDSARPAFTIGASKTYREHVAEGTFKSKD